MQTQRVELRVGWVFWGDRWAGLAVSGGVSGCPSVCSSEILIRVTSEPAAKCL